MCCWSGMQLKSRLANNTLAKKLPLSQNLSKKVTQYKNTHKIIMKPGSHKHSRKIYEVANLKFLEISVLYFSHASVILKRRLRPVFSTFFSFV